MSSTYRVATSNDSEKLEDRIHMYLTGGWKLSGGVSVAVDVNGRPTYAQAVINQNEG